MIYVSAMFVLAQLRSASKQHRRQPHDTGVAIGGGPRFGAWLDKPRLRHILDTELGNEIIVRRFGRNHCEKSHSAQKFRGNVGNTLFSFRCVGLLDVLEVL